MGLPRLKTLLGDEFKQVDVLVVYIKEAHAVDEWKLGDVVSIKQHKNLDQRIAAAKRFQQSTKFEMPLVVDTMDNSFCETYASWPERAYIIGGGGFLEYICDVNTDGDLDWEAGLLGWLRESHSKQDIPGEGKK